MGWFSMFKAAQVTPVERDQDLIRETSALRIEQREIRQRMDHKDSHVEDLFKRVLDEVKGRP